MKTTTYFLLILFSLASLTSCEQSIPLVYGAENMGKEFAKPVLPNLDQLPVVDVHGRALAFTPREVQQVRQY